MLQNSKINHAIVLKGFLFSFLLIILFSIPSVNALETVGSDSRIRTFIFGKNDVYRITSTFGYQTTIEFEKSEKIKTISLGNSGYFKLTPQKNTIFIKPIVPNIITNMTVITDKRNYQIELSSVMESLAEIIYLVRFYYPDSQEDDLKVQPRNFASVPEVSIPANYTPPVMQPMPAPVPFTPMNSTPVMGKSYNYNYTLTGPENISPSEVFDDGTNTYFRFFQSMPPTFRVISPGGGEIPTGYKVVNGYYMINTVAPKFDVYFGNQKVSIFNESLGGI